MPFEIIPIDMEKVHAWPANRDLEHGLLELHKPYVIEDNDVNLYSKDPDGYNQRPVSGLITLNDKQYHVGFGLKPFEAGFKVSRVLSEPNSDPVINRWGDWFGKFGVIDGELSDWFINMIYNYRIDYFTPEQRILSAPQFDYKDRIKLFNPMRSAIAHGKISVYQSRKDFDSDRQVAMKPGRAIKLMFPELEDAKVLMLVDTFLDKYATREYTIHTSQDAEMFKKAYSGDQVATQNINHSEMHKSLACSCMRYTFKDGNGPMNLPRHPVEAYASGDFTIVYTEDSEGLISGRCVVCTLDTENITHGPIYGACVGAIDMIEHHLRTMGSTPACDGDWEGARLLAIPHNEDENIFIAPYIDVEPRSLTAGQYLVIDRSGDIDANCYQGVLNSGERCHDCSQHVDEYETHYSEHTGYTYCSDCYYEDHFFCEYIQEDCHVDESIRVFYIVHGNVECDLAHNSVDLEEDVALCSDGEHWKIDECHYCEDEDEFISPNSMKNYFFSSWDGELYHNDRKVITENGDDVTKEELDNDDADWKLVDGAYEYYIKVEEEENNET